MAKRKIIWSARAKIDQYKILDYYISETGIKYMAENFIPGLKPQ